jgi:hypothetical protein
MPSRVSDFLYFPTKPFLMPKDSLNVCTFRSPMHQPESKERKWDTEHVCVSVNPELESCPQIEREDRWDCVEPDQTPKSAPLLNRCLLLSDLIFCKKQHIFHPFESRAESDTGDTSTFFFPFGLCPLDLSLSLFLSLSVSLSLSLSLLLSEGECELRS